MKKILLCLLTFALSINVFAYTPETSYVNSDVLNEIKGSNENMINHPDVFGDVASYFKYIGIDLFTVQATSDQLYDLVQSSFDNADATVKDSIYYPHIESGPDSKATIAQIKKAIESYRFTSKNLLDGYLITYKNMKLRLKDKCNTSDIFYLNAYNPSEDSSLFDNAIAREHEGYGVDLETDIWILKQMAKKTTFYLKLKQALLLDTISQMKAAEQACIENGELVSVVNGDQQNDFISGNISSSASNSNSVSIE